MCFVIDIAEEERRRWISLLQMQPQLVLASVSAVIHLVSFTIYIPCKASALVRGSHHFLWHGGVFFGHLAPVPLPTSSSAELQAARSLASS